MSTSVQTRQNGGASQRFMVISRTEDGFRVYEASNPRKQYFVHGDLDNPTCTCDGFAEDSPNGETCEHYRAVCEQVREDDQSSGEERRAIQAEGRPSPRKKAKRNNSSPAALMTLKRSVSPDGRIDSLSVELSCPIDQVQAADIKTRATNMLSLQREIAGSFLAGQGKKNGNTPGNGNHKADNTIPAKMLSIGGTRNGNFSISFQANGNGAKFFGSKAEIAQAIRSAGFQYSEEDVVEGVYLNLPCRVITKATADGRYVNVNRILPASARVRSGS